MSTIEPTHPASAGPAPILVLGVVGSAAVAVGGTLAGGGAAAGSPDRWFWDVPTIPFRPEADLLPALVGFYAGLILLSRAWLQLRRWAGASSVVRSGHPGGTTVVVVAFVLWAVPLVLGPPLASRDVYSYVAVGELAAAGNDPYEVGPAALGQDAGLGAVDPLWRSTPTPYGPAFVGVARVADGAGRRLGRLGPIYAFRLAALAALALVLVHLPRLARAHGGHAATALALVLCSPLTLLHLVSGAHNDALMVGLLVTGLAIGSLGWRPDAVGARWHPALGRRGVDPDTAPSTAQSPRVNARASAGAYVAGIALVALAGAVKAPALLGVAWLAWCRPGMDAPVTARARALAGAAVVATGVVAATSELTGYGWGWVGAGRSVGSVAAYLSPTTAIVTALAWVARTIGHPPDVAALTAVVQVVCAALAVLVATTLLARSHRTGLRALGGALLVVALLLPALHPWYLAWGVVLLAAAAPQAARGIAVLSIGVSFAVLPGGPDLGHVLLEQASPLTVGLAILALVPLTLRWGPAWDRLRRGWAPAVTTSG